MEVSSIIKRSSPAEQKIVRASVPQNFREQSEVKAAYEQVEKFPSSENHRFYADIYDFYQNNEC